MLSMILMSVLGVGEVRIKIGISLRRNVMGMRNWSFRGRIFKIFSRILRRIWEGLGLVIEVVGV